MGDVVDVVGDVGEVLLVFGEEGGALAGVVYLLLYECVGLLDFPL